VEKAEAALTVAPTLLGWRGVPGPDACSRALPSAAFGQRPRCPQVLEAGGAYLLRVKEHPPTLYNAIRRLVAPPPSLATLPLRDQREAQAHERGQGRQDAARHLVAATDLNASAAWPGLAQVFRLRRTWREHGQSQQAVHYGLPSLAPEAGPPERLLALKRGPWRIENGLHRITDVALGADQSTIHPGPGPTVMALLRAAALNLLRRRGVRQISARLRYHRQHPAAAVALLVAPPPVDAAALPPQMRSKSCTCSRKRASKV
jgi:predicted transposase YbfD/YdcC